MKFLRSKGNLGLFSGSKVKVALIYYEYKLWLNFNKSSKFNQVFTKECIHHGLAEIGKMSHSLTVFSAVKKSSNKGL